MSRVSGLAGRAVDVQLVSGGLEGQPLSHVSGTLHIDEAGSDRAPRDVSVPVVLCVEKCSFWLWPERFVDAHEVGPRALELVTRDAVLVIGPADESWLEERHRA
jgi:hypothetical protein